LHNKFRGAVNETPGFNVMIIILDIFHKNVTIFLHGTFNFNIRTPIFCRNMFAENIFLRKTFTIGLQMFRLGSIAAQHMFALVKKCRNLGY
jgi:hypothetical protein